MNEITNFFEETSLTTTGQNVILQIENELAAAKARETELRTFLLKEMEEKGIKKVDTGYFTITYKDAYDKESVDSKRLREEQPDIYDDYCKISQVKSSIVIKVKEKRDE